MERASCRIRHEGAAVCQGHQPRGPAKFTRSRALEPEVKPLPFRVGPDHAKAATWREVADPDVAELVKPYTCDRGEAVDAEPLVERGAQLRVAGRKINDLLGHQRSIRENGHQYGCNHLSLQDTGGHADGDGKAYRQRNHARRDRRG